MKVPKPSKARSVVALGIAATSALLIVGPGSTAAIAGRLIGSAAIQNNSIRSIDIHNGTIKGIDIKPGSLTAADFSGAMPGATGKTGPRGPAGAGGGNSERIVTWRVHYVATTNTSNVLVTSTQKVPAGTQVVAVNVTSPTGDWSACTSSSISVQDEFGRTSLANFWRNNNTTWAAATNALPGGGVTMTAPTALSLYGYCYGSTGAAPVPSFDMTLTLALTKRNTTATGTFN